MTFIAFIDYIDKHAPDVLTDSRSGSPLYSDMSHHAVNSDAYLVFDGKNLHWKQEGMSISWPAVSGESETMYSIEAQRLKNTGPIPEGFYLVHQERYQERPDDIWESMKSAIFRGTWPGGYKAWGNQRIWLEPEAGTETYGRSGMSIHGGEVAGSRGCIDLTNNMEDFSRKFRGYGKCMRLEVKYGEHK